jgi:SAM-dependent methyltransferase
MVLTETFPNWRDLAIHESSPTDRGISLKLAREGNHYIRSRYFPDRTPGVEIDGYRNENLESQTLQDASIDLAITLDVHEHLFNPKAAYQETFRVLKPGGAYLHTYPIQRSLMESIRQRAILNPDQTIRHMREPEYHGNPFDRSGSLVTIDYGYDIHKTINEWASFDVRILRFCDPTHGILGEFTEVILCRKVARQLSYPSIQMSDPLMAQLANVRAEGKGPLGAALP